MQTTPALPGSKGPTPDSMGRPPIQWTDPRIQWAEQSPAPTGGTFCMGDAIDTKTTCRGGVLLRPGKQPPPCPESKGPPPDSKGLTPESMGRSPDSMGRAEPCPYGVTILHGRCHRHKNNPVGAGFYSAHANNPRLALNPKDRPPNPKDRPPIQWADPGFNGQSRALPLRGEHFAWVM